MKLSSSTVSRAVQYPCTSTNETYSVRTCSAPRLVKMSLNTTTTRCCTLTVHHRPAAAKAQPMTVMPRLPSFDTRIDHDNGEHDHDQSQITSGWDYYSRLGKRWKEYQGIGNWDGLLDPLDENLRREILRYGGFVDAAYKSFEFDPSSGSYGACKFPKRSLLESSGLCNTGYRLTCNLRATSGISLPRWAPSSLVRSSWIGYVAVCQDRDEIARLGRRDVVIAFRGTATALEWLENLRATLTSVGPTATDDQDPRDPMVESGFLSLYTSGTRLAPSLQQMVRAEISRLLQTYGDEPLSLTITGHSLGAALATLAAYDIKTHFNRAPLVTVISFGGPRVGNRSFRHCLDKQGTKVLRIVNSDDLITKVPGFVLDNNSDNNGNGKGHVSKENRVHVSGLPRWIQRRVEDTPWVYAEVGKELRLSSRDCPHLLGNGFNSVATCHDLRTYLHLVENFVSSTCPIRATARKLLRKNRTLTI